DMLATFTSISSHQSCQFHYRHVLVLHFLLLSFFFFFFHCSLHLRDLHSFPTRRSSDLTAAALYRIWGIILFRINFSAIFFTTPEDWKSTRLNSSHLGISYAVFCLKKKKQQYHPSAKQKVTVCKNPRI